MCVSGLGQPVLIFQPFSQRDPRCLMASTWPWPHSPDKQRGSSFTNLAVSSTGRAAVSKTAGWRFESFTVSHFARLPCVERVFGCVADAVAHPALLPSERRTRRRIQQWDQRVFARGEYVEPGRWHHHLPSNGMTRVGVGRWALCRCLIPASAQPPGQPGDGLRLHAGSRPECGYTVSPAARNQRNTE